METIKRNTKRVGDISEAAVIFALVKRGYDVSIPFGENHRYDVLIDDGQVIQRVQIKSGRLRKGVVGFAACSAHSHRGGPFSRGYRGEVDYFGVYCRDNDNVYLVPCSHVPETYGSLRIDRPKHGQIKKIRWASGYLIGRGTPKLVGADAALGVTAQDPQLLFRPS